MKSTIEYFITFTNSETKKGKENFKFALIEFNLILTCIQISCGKDNLRSFLETQKFNHFVYGFGANHMWLHQVVDGKQLKERLLIVEF